MHLSRITLYPIKSLDGIDVPEATVNGQGRLEHDRDYALFDPEGKRVDGKRQPAIHQISARYDDNFESVTLARRSESSGKTFRLADTASIEKWMSDYFNFKVEMRYDPVHGFSDARMATSRTQIATGPTIISTETIRAAAGWFENVDEENMRFRLRTSFEIDAAPAFAEDQLHGEETKPTRFRIGALQLNGLFPCERCVVPSRDPFTGEGIPLFQKTFTVAREKTLPESSRRDLFRHFYSLSVRTSIPVPQKEMRVRVGDVLEMQF